MGVAQEVCVYVVKANNRGKDNTQHWWEKAMQSTNWKWKWTFQKGRIRRQCIKEAKGLRIQKQNKNCKMSVVFEIFAGRVQSTST